MTRQERIRAVRREIDDPTLPTQAVLHKVLDLIAENPVSPDEEPIPKGCRWCARGEFRICGAKFGEWVCSCPAHHSGVHVACGPADHDARRWSTNPDDLHRLWCVANAARVHRTDEPGTLAFALDAALSDLFKEE